ncbi:invasin domain 3-containing protein, partial [Serratia sp. N21D137]|uniref:invasin domain 3-containing protein n=1 Tax=Serratia sp. N21D137 TaxID=3397495 RepID=UPI0039E0DC69
MLSASRGTITANGVDASELTLALTDVNGNPVTGAAVAFETVLTNTAFSAVAENAGVYTARMSGTTAGSATVSVTVNGAPLAVKPVTVLLTADSSRLSGASVLSASRGTITANGVDASELTLALTDVNGNPVTGAAVAFETVLTNTAFSAVAENAGVYTARMSGTTAGSAAVSVTVNGAPLAVKPVTVLLTADS